MPLRSLLLAVAILVVPGAGYADSFRPEPVRPGAKISIQGYGRQNPQCRAWTNGCVLCSSDGEAALCSTPGIACEPHGITCKDMRRD